jgi:hypothetical protein
MRPVAFSPRYGRPPLATDAVGTVAGVSDPEARTLEVHLNGEHDNGCLMGIATARSTRWVMMIPWAGALDSFGSEFIGSI